MNRQRRTGLLAVGFFCALALVLGGVWLAVRPAASAGEKTVTVEVLHGDGSRAEFSYETDEAYLGPLLEKEGLISGSDSAYGLFVDTVDGEQAVFEKDGAWWQLFCNGESASAGADSVPMGDGDVFTWAYTVG